MSIRIPNSAMISRLMQRFSQAQSIGERGERAAARYLKRNGFEIITRNLRIGRDEADILAIDRREKSLVIVEVKTRHGTDPSPELAVHAGKQHRLTRLAANLKKQQAYRDMPLRFDVIAVNETSSGPKIRHFKSAFDASF